MKDIKTKLSALRAGIKKNRHAFLLLYFIFYLALFIHLERTIVAEVWVTSPLDKYIPFNELFVIPYVFWYFQIAFMLLYFLFTSKEDYLKLCGFLFTGMTISLIIYMIIPNGVMLRPTEFAHENVLINIVQIIYKADTPTNVCPSIHCLNAIGMHIGVIKSKKWGKNKKAKLVSLIIMLLICMSTVFIKQHSVTDIIAAIILAIPLYLAFYYLPEMVMERKAKKAGVTV